LVGPRRWITFARTSRYFALCLSFVFALYLPHVIMYRADTWYKEPGCAELTSAYAWIRDMFVHEMFPGGPVLHFIHGDWPDVLPDLSSTGLTQVRRNPESSFNKYCSLTSLEGIVPYNLAFLPQNLADRGCDTFAVIDRVLRLGKRLPDYL
jgi:hypothetical protein